MIHAIDDIITAWAADATLGGTVAGPWLGEAKDGGAYPYAVYTVSGQSNNEYFFDRTLVEKTTYRFTVYHTNAAELNTYFRAMEDLLLQQEFGDTTGTSADKFVRVKRGVGGPIFGCQSQVAQDGKAVYYATSTYEIHTQRTLP